MADNDLKQQLQQLAQEAPDTASLRDRLVPRIRRRRRIRQTVLTASTICGVGAVTAGVMTGVSMHSPEPIRQSNPADPAEAPADQDSLKSFGTCGSRIATPSATTPPLQLTAVLPTAPLKVTDDRPFLQIDMSVTNMSPSSMRVITSKGAVMAITSNGLVVASPERGVRTKGYVYNLQPAATANYKSTIYLRSCDAGSGTLPPGHYQLHALQGFTILTDDPRTRPLILVPGGPWEIEIG